VQGLRYDENVLTGLRSLTHIGKSLFYEYISNNPLLQFLNIGRSQCLGVKREPLQEIPVFFNPTIDIECDNGEKEVRNQQSG
jgi:hypothetical protein